jgi:uncharacterized protein (TIGR02466 family)
MPHIVQFATELGYSQDQLELMYIDNMWSNFSHEGDYATIHNHPGSIISAAFYLEAPQDSFIQFYDTPNVLMPPTTYTQYSSEWVRYPCVANTLYMFRSDFLHGTNRQTSGRKIVVSFNVSIGHKI